MVTIVEVANGYIIEHNGKTYVATSVWDIHQLLKSFYEEKENV